MGRCRVHQADVHAGGRASVYGGRRRGSALLRIPQAQARIFPRHRILVCQKNQEREAWRQLGHCESRRGQDAGDRYAQNHDPKSGNYGDICPMDSVFEALYSGEWPGISVIDISSLRYKAGPKTDEEDDNNDDNDNNDENNNNEEYYNT
jgi:hypothetical protein